MARLKFNERNLDLFWWFVCERQRIWHNRHILQKQRPWTSDSILQTNRFTNVYRELDPGTQYAIKQILELDKPKPDKLFNLILYRLIGRSETHASVGFQGLGTFDSRKLERQLKRIRNEGKPVFTAAYMVAAYTRMGSTDKIENIARLFGKVSKQFSDTYARIEKCESLQDVYDVLRSVEGLGNFLAYQVLVDATYPLVAYKDKPLLPYSQNDWAAAGPGAQRGVRLLSSSPSIEVMRWLHQNQEKEFQRLGLDFPYLQVGGKPVRISLANIQNCLCEFHKYVKISDGTGRARRKFMP